MSAQTSRTANDPGREALRLLDALRMRSWVERAAGAAATGLWLGAGLIALSGAVHLGLHAHAAAPVLALGLLPASLLAGWTLGRGRPSRARAAREADARLGSQALLASALDQCARPVERRAPMAALVLAQADAFAAEQRPRVRRLYPLLRPRRLLVPLVLALGFACAYLLPGARPESLPVPTRRATAAASKDTIALERGAAPAQDDWSAVSTVRVHASSRLDEPSTPEAAEQALPSGPSDPHERGPAAAARATPSAGDSSALGDERGLGAGDAARDDAQRSEAGTVPKLVILYREPRAHPDDTAGRASSGRPGRAPEFGAPVPTRGADAVSKGAQTPSATLAPALRAYVGAYMADAAPSQAAARRP